MAAQLLLLLLPFLFHLSSAAQLYNIADYGAKPDGSDDSASQLAIAWTKACSSIVPATLLIPPGKFLVSQAWLQGPCRNNKILIVIKGIVMAPSSYTSNEQWIIFKRVNGLTISGGLLDGHGQALWSCKSLSIAYSNNVWIDRVSSVNSEQFHITIYRSSHVKVTRAVITAPFDSPNTDGIHIEESSDVEVKECRIGTGDDCISMGPGDSNVWIENVRCGPGHGISIGSLGSSSNQDGVKNVTVKNVQFTGTENGLRIKTWAKPSNAFAQQILFQNATMDNVKNPIIIDQNYCPDHLDCPNQSSGVQISDVTFRDVVGSSATNTAVKLDCSKSKPCEGIMLQNINLGYNGSSEAEMVCSNVHGGSSGVVIPPCCISK
ncbi:Polygalacturonase [Dendrobium catenatum]|uniref:Exopolygalacturonase n=1 Tax=Dendrobium catenatum TaxID=906689 RepID=A0A2I0W8P4_9ASPA|nr:Polygalacturonase [Dendrobium catenatum]